MLRTGLAVAAKAAYKKTLIIVLLTLALRLFSISYRAPLVSHRCPVTLASPTAVTGASQIVHC
ncbi:MAG TPA: hypothetical protein DEH07_05600 [Desulfotomaculum sp.]|nr:hypothetical protein [Desulfotomaculum sp.]